jgi:hypothetical protein
LAVEQAPSNASDSLKSAYAGYAAHAILNDLVPWLFYKHDATLAPFVSSLSAQDANAAQISGTSVATALITLSANDGVSNYVKFTPSPANGPAGAYQFVTNQTYALYPQLATATPFVISNVSSFDQGPPHPLNSSQYKADLAEVYVIGVKNSTNRTQYQTDTACKFSTNKLDRMSYLSDDLLLRSAATILSFLFRFLGG